MTDETPVVETSLEVEEAKDEAVESAASTLKAAEKVAETPQETTTLGESTASALLLRIAEQNAKTQGLLMEMQQQAQNNADAFSRALAGTDISAQRAAQASETIATALEPPEATRPDASQQPDDIKELPVKDIQSQRNKRFYFGKAALRHGK